MLNKIIIILMAVIFIVFPTHMSLAQQEDSLFTGQVVYNDSTIFSTAVDIGRWDALGVTFEVHNDSTADPAANDSLWFGLYYRIGDNEGWAELDYPDTTTYEVIFHSPFTGQKSQVYFIALDDSIPKSARRIQFILKSDSTNVSVNQAKFNMKILRIGKEGLRFPNVGLDYRDDNAQILGLNYSEKAETGPALLQASNESRSSSDGYARNMDSSGYLRKQFRQPDRK